MKNGTKVRFTLDHLGASERHVLHRVVDEEFGREDTGVVSFEHPAKHMAKEGWFYVEVSSKVDGRKLYVGITANECEEIE